MKQWGVGTGLQSTNKFSLRQGRETRLATTALCQNIPAELRRNPKLSISCSITRTPKGRKRNAVLGSSRYICITHALPPLVGAFAGKHSVFQMSAEHISPKQDQTCTLPWSNVLVPSLPHPNHTHIIKRAYIDEPRKTFLNIDIYNDYNVHNRPALTQKNNFFSTNHVFHTF